MIDTVKIYLSKRELMIDAMPFNLILRKMEYVKKISDSSDKLIGVVGMIGNFNVKLTHDYISLNGSLCKFLKGNNIDTLTRPEIKLAIDKLSKSVGLPIAKGYLRRIDIGRNFKMGNYVIDYFNVLKETPKYLRNIHITTLKYTRGQYVLCFYDKGKEVADKAMNTNRKSETLNRSMMLRYELKIEGNVAKRLKYQKAKVALLFSPTFLNKLNEKWYRHYEKIVKEKRFVFSEKVDGVKELRTQIELAGIENFGGETVIRAYIDDLRKKNNWTYKQTHDANRMVDKILNNPVLIEDIDLVKELNQIVYDAYVNND
jgi:hypothetical protein